MNKREIFNVFSGSVLASGLLVLWIGFVTQVVPESGTLAWFVIGVIALGSIVLAQIYSRKIISLLFLLVAISIACLALYFSQGLQLREGWRFFLLPAGALILTALNLVVSFVRSSFQKKPAPVEKGKVSKIDNLAPIVLALVIFVLPLFLILYLSLFMPPLVESDFGVINYDFVWQQDGNSQTGLLAQCHPRVKGNRDKFHWITTAYLLSREWYESPDEPWRERYYVRRARFYRSGVKSFGHNAIRDFESHKCADDLFLPYSVIEEGMEQGDFSNYNPEHLNVIVSSSDKIQFAVELISVVAKSKGKYAVEGVYGKHRRTIVPLDEYAGYPIPQDNYPNSRWLALTGGAQSYRPGVEQPVPQSKTPGDQPPQTQGPSQEFADYLTQVRDQFLAPLREAGTEITDQQRLKIMGYALRLQAQKLGTDAAGQARYQKVRAEARAFLEGVSPDESVWSLVEKAEQGMFDDEVKRLLEGAPAVETLQTLPRSGSIPLLNAEVTSMNFYEGGKSGVPQDQKNYRERFPKADTRYIYWELNLKHPAPGRRIDFAVDAVWYRPDGSVFAEQTLQTFLEESWTSSSHQYGRGWDQPGNWPAGTYRVELSIEGQEKASGTFEIY